MDGKFISIDGHGAKWTKNRRSRVVVFTKKHFEKSCYVNYHFKKSLKITFL